MFKFINGHMTSIDGIEMFPIVSLILFVSLFVLILCWTIIMKKELIGEVSSIPIDRNDK